MIQSFRLVSGPGAPTGRLLFTLEGRLKKSLRILKNCALTECLVWGSTLEISLDLELQGDVWGRQYLSQQNTLAFLGNWKLD